MASTAAKVYVHATERILGQWCPNCLLSTGISFEAWHTTKQGFPLHLLAAVTYCPECGEWERSEEGAA